MTLSSLLALLEDGSITEVRAAIARPLVAFRRGLMERGRSTPIELDIIGESAVVKAAHVALLLNAYGNGLLTQIELRYLASALDLSPDASYDNNVVRDVVSHLSDSETVNVPQLLEELRTGAAA